MDENKKPPVKDQFHEVRCPKCDHFLGDISADHPHTEHFQCHSCPQLWRVTVNPGFLPVYKPIPKDYPKSYVSAGLRVMENG